MVVDIIFTTNQYVKYLNLSLLKKHFLRYDFISFVISRNKRTDGKKDFG